MGKEYPVLVQKLTPISWSKTNILRSGVKGQGHQVKVQYAEYPSQEAKRLANDTSLPLGSNSVKEAKKLANASYFGQTFRPGGQEAGQCLLFGAEFLPGGRLMPPNWGRTIYRRPRGWPIPPIWGRNSTQEAKRSPNASCMGHKFVQEAKRLANVSMGHKLLANASCMGHNICPGGHKAASASCTG